MRSTLFALVVACNTAIAWATDAPEVNNSPSAQFIAKTPGGGNQNVQAEIAVQGNPNGTGAWFTININNPGMSLADGPFLYHIHEKAVPSDGNCTATLAHLDPYARGETPPCQPTAPQTCQVGDLSGKHGKIEDLPGFSAQYTDAYISLIPGTPAYIGDKSFVLHYANKTRIMCVNFKEVVGNSSTTTTTTSGNSTMGGGSSTSTTTFPVGGSNSTTTGGTVPSGTTVTVGGAGGAAGPNTATTGSGAAGGTVTPASTGARSVAVSGVQSLGLVSLLAVLMFALA